MAGLNPHIRTVDGKVVLQVYMLDNSSKTLLIEPSCTAQTAVRIMAEKLGFRNPADDSLCFGLHLCKDGVTIERALGGDIELIPIMERWTAQDSPKFVFQCKLFTESIINSDDKAIIHLLYIQSVYNIISGVYPCTEEEAVQLAALQFQKTFGKHNPTSHRAGFLKDSLMEYIPAPLRQEQRHTSDEWEELIFAKHRTSLTEYPAQSYLSLLAKRDYYGAVLFAAKQEFTRSMPKQLLIGISRQGILLLRIPDSFTTGDFETLARYPLNEIYRWAYKPEINFYFEIKGEEEEQNPVYTFQTTEGQHMSDMLTDYAMALLREMGLNPDGTRREEAQSFDAPKYGAEVPEDAYRDAPGEVQAAAIAASRSGIDESPEEPVSYGAHAATDDQAYQAEDQQYYDQSQGYEQQAEQQYENYEAGYEQYQAEEEYLPPNWVKLWDDNNQAYYYYNEVSGESSWVAPQ